MQTKVFITTNATIGRLCKEWASKNLPPDTVLVDDMNECDIFISVFYDKIVSAHFISGRRKCFNFHGGLLPEYRGSGTLNFAILNGENETGVTLHEIDEKVDHGPVLEIKKFPIDSNATTIDLYNKAEEIIFQMFQKWFSRFVSLEYTAKEQNHEKSKSYTRAQLQSKRDITRFARTFHFPPKPQAEYRNKHGETVKLVWDDTPESSTWSKEQQIDFEAFRDKYLKPFRDLNFVYWPEKGFIVWRMSTGENAELLHIRTFIHGRGYATELVAEMVRQLQETPPYFSVFGLGIASRLNLKEIYRKLGFEVTDDLPAPYKDVPAFIFYQTYDKLKQRYLEN